MGMRKKWKGRASRQERDGKKEKRKRTSWRNEGRGRIGGEGWWRRKEEKEDFGKEDKEKRNEKEE